MEKTIVPIKGMHCRSCEILIEEKLQEIPGIKNITVSYKSAQADFYLNYPATIDSVKRAIRDAGYQVGEDKKNWISKNPADYKDLGIAALVLLGLYILAANLGLFNLSAGSRGNPSSLLVVLLVGLTAGVSTCMALVGGLLLGISARFSEKHPDATPAQKFRPHLFFNLGRIASYALLGGLIGLIGKAFQLSGPVLGTLMILLGGVMLVLGLQLTEIFPRISSAGFTLPVGLAKLLRIRSRENKEYSHLNSIITGTLTFFLPCGFTQAMQLFAMSTGNFWSGAAIMGVFALGTAPGLLGIGGLTSIVKGAFARKFFKFAGLLVIVLALINVTNGYHLTGLKGISWVKSSSTGPAVKIENGFQIVEMSQDAGGYNPDRFVIRKGVPVRWIIDARDTSSCSSSIVATKINVKKFLTPGQNTIEFTPKETGDILFSCSMGMYRGKFIVIENDASATTNTDVSNTPSGDNIQSNPPVTTNVSLDTQIIKARYVATDENSTTDISPNEFTVLVGKPVRFEVYAEIDGEGCMSTIKVPRLAGTPQFLEQGKTVIFEFTPKEKGTYLITCAMGAIRGKIIVN